MKNLLWCSMIFLLLAATAAAQDSNTTIQPHELSKQKPPLQLSDQQRTKIQDALVTAHSAQKAPDNWEAKVGAKVPNKLKLDAMPAPLINEEPVLKQYGFIKLEDKLLVVDPMEITIVAIIPRKFPAEQSTQGQAPSGRTEDPASHGHDPEIQKKINQ
jgi:hypothetical protein